MRRRPSLLLALVVAGGLVASACGAGVTTAASSDAAAPSLSSVTPLKDPRSYDGPTHAGLGDLRIDPVADDLTPALPVTVTDAQGTKVTVKDASRILALDVYGTLSQTVFELGLGSHVVGRDISTQFAEAKKLPLVTSNGHDLSAEAILRLDPSVIVTDTSLGPWDVLLQMRDAGIPVVVVDSERSIATIGSLTEEVATALGVPKQGRLLAARATSQTKATIAQIAKIAPADDRKKLRVVFLYVRGTAGVYYMFGEGSGADSLIDALGGYDVAHEINWKGMKPVTDEGLVAAQPDVVLMMTKGLASVGGVSGLLQRIPALAQTPAGQKKRIVDMDDADILSFGPRTPTVLSSLAVALYAPQAVASQDAK